MILQELARDHDVLQVDNIEAILEGLDTLFFKVFNVVGVLVKSNDVTGNLFHPYLVIYAAINLSPCAIFI